MPIRYKTSFLIILTSLLFFLSVTSAQEVTPDPTDSTENPVEQPTATYTAVPSEIPSLAPTETPAVEDPTQVASPTAETTPEPTLETTPEPTLETTPEPTLETTPAPTVAPDSLSLVFSTGFEDDATELSVQGWMSVNVENGKALQSGPDASILTYNTAYPNIALRLRVLLQDGTLSLALRQNGASGYTFILGHEGTLVLLRNGEEVASTQVARVPREWFMLEARAIGGKLSASIDGVNIFNYVESTPLPAGGLSVTSSAAALVRIDDLAILASDTAGDELTIQGQLYWGQPIITCHSIGTQVTHTWWFNANYWNYIIDFKRTSGDLRYDVYITGPSINGTLPSAPDGRMIIYGPDNGGGPAGNYDLTITGTSGSGCVETTIFSGYRPQNQIGWGFQSSNFTLKKWRYNLSSTLNHQVRVERTEGSGPINLKIWSPGGALLANTSSATGVIVWDYSNGPSGEYNVEIDISNGSYRWAVNGGLVHLAKPTGVTVTNRTHNSATISWIDNSVGEQDYVVYSPDGFNPILLPPDTRSYTFTGLNCSSSYRVIVYSKIANRNSEAGQIGDVPFSDFGNTPSFSTLPCQPAPTLKLPADGATLMTLRPSLSWFVLAGARRYEVRLSHNSSFSRPIVFFTTAQSLKLPSDLNNATYWWSVRAYDAAGNPSPWSEARRFTARSLSTAVPTLCRTITPSLTLNWEHVSWATAYEYQVSKTPGFETLNLVAFGTISGNPSAPTVTTGTLGNGRYFWRVRAQNSSGTWGRWSTVSSCSVAAP